FRTQAEMGHTCRGTINLATANINTSEDSCSFIISNGGAQTYHLKASSEVERQRWITALELAKAKAVKMQAESGRRWTCATRLGEGGGKKRMSVCYYSGSVRAVVVTKCTVSIYIYNTHSLIKRKIKKRNGFKRKKFNLQVVMQFISSDAKHHLRKRVRVNACHEFLKMAQTHSRKWQKTLQYERDQRIRLEETLEQLAKQHNNLERAFRGATVLPANSPGSASSSKGSQGKADMSDEDDENEFFDAMENAPEFITVPADPKFHKRTGSNISGTSSELALDGSLTGLTLPACASNSETSSSSSKELILRRKRRKCIPDKPNYSLNLWSIMKNCIGKELSKIPMPVNFNEPLSMLQRLTEDLEYHELLDRAAKCENSLEQLCYVAAFTVSSYSTTVFRTGKPFNPLLGETFELDRLEERGYRSICEQVSHHPPAAAHHAESKHGWTLRQEIAIGSKFRGKYLSIMPLGTIHCIFHNSGHHYTWKKVTTTVHNIIVGKLWIDQSGEIDIVNHKTGDQCHLKFAPYSYFSRDVARKLHGGVEKKKKKKKKMVNLVLLKASLCCQLCRMSRILSLVLNSQKKNCILVNKIKDGWRKKKKKENAENMYYFSELALTLNELEEGVAPTDSRLRPDQRLMENGRWDEANTEKQRLEEKQRAVRRKREAEVTRATEDGAPFDNYKALWFERKEDPVTKEMTHIYRGGYWEAKEKQDWSLCPDIF
uniref:Oxysterol-binding protein n=1 Tax=Latimeria chalumnae TaxID=7897 RepID=H3A5E0_LATCH